MIIGNRFHENNFGTDIFCNLLDLKFPEMGCLNLELPPCHCNEPVLGGFDTFTDFLALSYINLHGLFLHAITEHAGTL